MPDWRPMWGSSWAHRASSSDHPSASAVWGGEQVLLGLAPPWARLGYPRLPRIWPAGPLTSGSVQTVHRTSDRALAWRIRYPLPAPRPLNVVAGRPGAFDLDL